MPPGRNARRRRFLHNALDAGLLQLGEVWLHVERTDAFHRHVGHQIIVLLEGTLGLECDGRSLMLAQGEAVVIPAEAEHRAVRAGEAQAARLLDLRTTADASLLRREIARLPMRVVRIDLAEFNNLADRLASAGDSPSRARVLAAAWAMVAGVCEATEARHEQAAVEQRDSRLAVCETLIRDYLGTTDLSVQMLAERVQLSPSQLARLYRMHYGQSPALRIRTARLDRARHLLSATGYSVKQIAAACGMERAVNLTRAFQAAYGCTPSQYRHARQSR